MNTFFSTIWHEAPNLFSNRRRQLQDWDAKPPHALGWGIFIAVILEFFIARQLYHDLGVNRQILGQLFGLALTILIVEALLTYVTVTVAKYFKKKGDWKTTVTFFNIGLFPMLLFLPATLVFWACGWAPIIRLLIFLVLVGKVLLNWRESTEISHELTVFQSSFVLSSTFGLFLFLIALSFYVSLIGLVADMATVLR